MPNLQKIVDKKRMQVVKWHRAPSGPASWLYLRYFSVSAALHWKNSNGGGGESPYVSLIRIRTANAICGNFLALVKLVNDGGRTYIAHPQL